MTFYALSRGLKTKQWLFLHFLCWSVRLCMLSTTSVCNFQSMKSPVELSSLFLKLFCYITWFDQTRHWAPLRTRPLRQILLFLRNNSLPITNHLFLIHFSSDIRKECIWYMYNRDHNILRLVDVWPNFLITTIETKRDYW